MKKTLFLLPLIWLGACSSSSTSLNTGFEGKPLPSFNLLLTDSSTTLNTSNIPAGKPFVLIYFSPYCPYCRAETQDIVDNISALKNIQFYFLSNFPLSDIMRFNVHYKLNQYPNITVGQDKQAFFGTYYKAQGVPYTAIFNKDKRLVQSLIGKADANLINNIALE